jgi:hypothetical protein
MTEILNGLSFVSGDTKTEIVNESFSAELSAEYKMTKGNFSQNFYFWGRVYESKYKGFVHIDDLNNEERSCMLGNITIDNIHKLKETLKNSGLATLANSLGFTSDECKQAEYNVIENHKMFKACFGENTKLWELVPKEEQDKIKLQYVIDNYDSVGDYEKKGCGVEVVDGVGNVVKDGVPTKEQLIEKLESL